MYLPVSGVGVKRNALYQLIQQFIAGGTSREEILYINFEDERLLELNTEDLNRILEVYKELYPHKPIIFLDEIHNIEGWEKFVRRLADTQYRVFVTGSNAKMLSRDISTTLGGRFFVKEIFPLNFKEYLTFKGIHVDEQAIYSPRAFEIKREFDQFLSMGGFPESLHYPVPREYLSNIFKKVLYGDIVARHNIRNELILELLIKKLAESVGDECSYQRIHKLLKAAGAKLAQNTLVDYLKYCQDAYMIGKSINHLTKFAERESRKKYYFIDNGLLGLFFTKGKSQLLENFVYTHLLKTREETIYYLRENNEIDFYLAESEIAIQVAFGFEHPETREREINAFFKMKEIASLKKALLITDSEEELIQLNGLEVSVIPAWKWALAES